MEESLTSQSTSCLLVELFFVLQRCSNVAKGGDGTVDVYRAFGGDARAQGFSWTTKDPRSVSNFRDAAGLPSGGASGSTNTADFLIKGKAKASDIIESRSALPLDGNKGGLPELIIDPKNVNITDFSVLKPQVKPMENKYSGMTVNERLYASGLMKEFDEAIKNNDAEKARVILEKVELTEESIKPILEQHGLQQKESFVIKTQSRNFACIGLLIC